MSIEIRRDLLVQHLLEAGYTRDKWGNYVRDVHYTHRKTKERVASKMRVVFNDISCRVEVRGMELDRCGRFPWLRLTSAYYSKLKLCDDGRILVGSMFFGTSKATHCTTG